MMLQGVKAVIFGCESTKLAPAEKAFFADSNPYGFILFSRNCDTPDQVRDLVHELRNSVGREDAPVLIDQEGGRVQRLSQPHWHERPAQGVFARLAKDNLALAMEAARLNARIIAKDLMDLGIDVDCLPLLDVPVVGADDIIGDRAYGNDPDVISDLGRAVIEGLNEGGVTAVIKHIPGHGRAMVDSHLSLPTVVEKLDILTQSDFIPFVANKNAAWAMTAHIVYDAIDPKSPATLSDTVITRIIRSQIGFDGFLITDDMSMKALSGDIGENARKALEAGCDAVLHCNGEMAEMKAIADTVSPLSDTAMSRLNAAENMKKVVIPIDYDEAEARISELISDYL